MFIYYAELRSHVLFASPSSILLLCWQVYSAMHVWTAERRTVTNERTAGVQTVCVMQMTHAVRFNRTCISWCRRCGLCSSVKNRFSSLTLSSHLGTGHYMVSRTSHLTIILCSVINGASRTAAIWRRACARVADERRGADGVLFWRRAQCCLVHYFARSVFDRCTWLIVQTPSVPDITGFVWKALCNRRCPRVPSQ